MTKDKDKAVCEELEQIAASSGGVLRPADVVDFAEDDDTALHTHFDWDDSSAAGKYRLDQARRIIRLQVTYIQGKDEQVSIRAYHALPADRGQDSYRRTKDILSDSEQREQLVSMALRELQTLQHKYAHLTELAGVFSAIDQAASRKLDKKKKPRRKARRRPTAPQPTAA